MDYKCNKEKDISMEEKLNEFIKQVTVYGASRFNKIYELIKNNKESLENLEIVEMNFFYLVLQYEKDSNTMYYVIRNNKIEPNSNVEKLC